MLRNYLDDTVLPLSDHNTKVKASCIMFIVTILWAFSHQRSISSLFSTVKKRGGVHKYAATTHIYRLVFIRNKKKSIRVRGEGRFEILRNNLMR